MDFNINNLKKHLGPGLGLRTNRYLLELPMPTVNGETINILCQSAGLPETSIETTEMWHMGRRYIVRGETKFENTYTISIVDDSEMNIRQMFDVWLKKIDNTRPDKNASFLGASFEGKNGDMLDEAQSAVTMANQVKNTITNPRQMIDFAIGKLDENQALSAAAYQTDVNIWQLDSTGTATNSDKSKVYGYKFQNAYPTNIGIVTLDDSTQDTLSQFSVTLTFSEMIPLYGNKEDIARAVIGDQTMDIAKGIGNLF